MGGKGGNVQGVPLRLVHSRLCIADGRATNAWRGQPERPVMKRRLVDIRRALVAQDNGCGNHGVGLVTHREAQTSGDETLRYTLHNTDVGKPRTRMRQGGTHEVGGGHADKDVADVHFIL